ncbi:hypothetical protein DKX38_002237 [Salix brachista]|uniref:Co-chaperone protein p23 n=1 Tax=Salix brachista TaxID=2182728 RepID=A0A5N5NLN6_9ROSI|nr:hypothetical protein DKX38_002237 [Salix brachista]
MAGSGILDYFLKQACWENEIVRHDFAELYVDWSMVEIVRLLLTLRRHPSVKWAQRSDNLFITVQLPDAQDVKLKLEPEGKFFFSATSGADKIPYEIELELFDKIIVEDSKTSIGSRSIHYIVKKAENKWWGRLIKQTGKPPVFLTVDWDKWIDEDEEFTRAPEMGDTGFDFPGMNLGGGGGFDGMNLGGGGGFDGMNLGGGGGFDGMNFGGGGGFGGPAPEMDDGASIGLLIYNGVHRDDLYMPG